MSDKQQLDQVLKAKKAQMDKEKLVVEQLVDIEEQQVKAALENFRREIKSKQADTQNLLKTVIEPWWISFVKQQLPSLEVLTPLSNHHPFKVSSDFVHFNPRSALSWNKESAIELNRFALQSLGHELPRPDFTEFWRGFFAIRSNGKKPNLVVGLWPRGKGSMAFSMMAPRLEVTFGNDNMDFAKKVSPVVIAGFASEIQSGHVWQIIADNI